MCFVISESNKEPFIQAVSALSEMYDIFNKKYKFINKLIRNVTDGHFGPEDIKNFSKGGDIIHINIPSPYTSLPGKDYMICFNIRDAEEKNFLNVSVRYYISGVFVVEKIINFNEDDF